MSSWRGGLFGFRLFYRLPRCHGAWLGTGGDAFLAALLIPAMALREPLFIDGPVSRTLLDNLRRAMDLLVAWNAANPWIRLHRVPLAAATVVAPEPASGSALFFSGGVDSFYALRQPGSAAVRHLVFVHGFDLPLERPDLRRSISHRLRQAAAATGRDLVEVETNYRTLSDPIVSWTMAHGGALAAVGHALAGGARRFGISATDIYGTGATWGTHPQLDRLWSSGVVEFASVGAEARRGSKLAALRDFVPAQEHLRVCWNHTSQAYNCCRCRKCLRTMLHLYIHGALGRFPTFPHPPPLDLLERMIEPPHLWFLWDDLAAGLEGRGETEVAAQVRRMLQRSRRHGGERSPQGRRAAAAPIAVLVARGATRSPSLVWLRRLHWRLRRQWWALRAARAP
ncbi:MAG TPA: hypothetical protein VMT16_09100 [Thermoanaerobaculia bacterium]|nr:hypothetical protein [Thermoanaerobaculia bacterium]